MRAARRAKSFNALYRGFDTSRVLLKLDEERKYFCDVCYYCAFTLRCHILFNGFTLLKRWESALKSRKMLLFDFWIIQGLEGKRLRNNNYLSQSLFTFSIPKESQTLNYLRMQTSLFFILKQKSNLTGHYTHQLWHKSLSPSKRNLKDTQCRNSCSAGSPTFQQCQIDTVENVPELWILVTRSCYLCSFFCSRESFSLCPGVNKFSMLGKLRRLP